MWGALARRGYLGSGWPWRAVAYLVSGALFGAVVLVVLAGGVVVGGALAVVLLGFPVLGLTALSGIPVAAVERRRLRLAGVGPVFAGQHRVPGRPGLPAWLTTRVREAATWRELAYALLLGLVLWPLDAAAVLTCVFLPLSMVAAPVLVAVGGEAKVLKVWLVDGWPAASVAAGLGLVLLAAGAYALGVLAGARAELARALLTARGGDRVTELVRSRARLVDAFEAERRRIERDLHDGAQQRLVALGMALGLARLDAPPGTPLAEQLARAHREAELALADLRELIHGIHPKVLADYGLEAAVADAADRSPVPVDLELSVPGRLPRPVESAAYFVVCEALANVAKHSGAARATVRGGHADGRLWLEIGDDGRGGADPAGGSGLTGLADRVSVLDGTLSLSSPPGGPTLLRVELPCRPTDPCG
ncbi:MULTISPECIES: sensor histidine kinase [unclassified Streptomyces]|uniref:sensor histidine kinase n=1 Tax=unclassified Streptomyces TaxID=2593676 RepID=UPI001BE63D9F|nr:sensor histidine kinase [Streptomyces sp. ISL-12]MBT2410480.1 sensor histidine kinase [Streptomyces sp. ISL-12]